MAVLAHDLACASTVHAFISVELQPEILATFHYHSSRKQLPEKSSKLVRSQDSA